LRERRAENFYRAEARQEQKYLDELGARKFARRRGRQHLP
jgi:flagellar biosynthesis chaperone FliJ